MNTTLRRETKKQLEMWDRDQGRAMQHAESLLKQSTKAFDWSPALRDAGLIYRYWRLRLRELRHNANYEGTFDRITQTIAQHTSNYSLPFRTDRLTMEEVQYQLKAARKTLKERQLASVDLRYRSYQDHLSVYENDQKSRTSKESKRKAKIVGNTIRSEQSKAMNRNIRNVVKPSDTGSITKIQVPRHRDRPELPNDYQTFLAETSEEDIVWDTLLDKESINANLLRFNRNSFRAASASPCGHGPLYKSLTFNSLSREAAEILSGQIPATWQGNDHTLREFLTSFAIPDSV